ncbi:MAG TPA: hemerythrin domain-containing protein, partial [Acidimicrobiia bacterium]|nr:hemerythrin domain-containing protein [Acidimicrobiia bacterium]
MATVESEGRGLVAEVQRDHREIERMLERVDRTTGTERRDAFEELARKLVVHETAEELLVHPLLQHTDAEPVADEM